MSSFLLGTIAFGLALGAISLLLRISFPGDLSAWLWLPVTVMVTLVLYLLVPTRCVSWPFPILPFRSGCRYGSPSVGLLFRICLPVDLCSMGSPAGGSLHVTGRSLPFLTWAMMYLILANIALFYLCLLPPPILFPWVSGQYLCSLCSV